jgi:Leucine-rich repeat (LRR) protein
MKEWNVLQEDKPITLSSVSLNTKHLDLSHTKITQLPDYITKLQNLDILYMNNNHFHDLPQGVQKLTTLKVKTIFRDF